MNYARAPPDYVYTNDANDGVCTNSQDPWFAMEIHHQVDEPITDLKTFIQISKLSAPTVKKWLQGAKIYNSSKLKLEDAMRRSKLTKEDLMDMYNHQYPQLRQREVHPSYSLPQTYFNGPCSFPSISETIAHVKYHYYILNDIYYVCAKTNSVFDEHIQAHSLENYSDLQKIVEYWENNVKK